MGELPIRSLIRCPCTTRTFTSRDVDDDSVEEKPGYHLSLTVLISGPPSDFTFRIDANLHLAGC